MVAFQLAWWHDARINLSTDIYVAFMDRIHAYPDIRPDYSDTEVFSRQKCRRI